jgi:hypothetical protein
MNYYHLKSIVAAGKKEFQLREASESFFLAAEKTKPYIEPSFDEIFREAEKPTIILISAVGATGKTALAQQLSRDSNLPILDLSKHKPVGANTLTGLLTRQYDIKEISNVLEGLASGSYGIIIDGLDEGRSKTTDEAFEAFLDDIVTLCRPGTGTTFVMLGRTGILEDCWAYLSDKGLEPALITIAPFTVDRAREYIDAFTTGPTSAYAKQYGEARDFIIERLGTAFSINSKENSEEFLSFIGYPPVLDAIATLLNEEQNYQKLLDSLTDEEGSIVEVSLLYRIAAYILQRERTEKVILNIVEPLVAGLPNDIRDPALRHAYSCEEQCARLIAHCLGRSLSLSTIPEKNLNEKYEEGLRTFVAEHPFIRGREFRNAVFEAVALATLMTSGNSETESFVGEYIGSHKHSYHLVYMLDTITADHQIAISDLNTLLLAALEFRSVHANVEIRVDGPDPEEMGSKSVTEVQVEIEILLGAQQEASKTFSFVAEVGLDTRISLGPRLAGAFISVPCDVTIGGGYEVELTPPVEISARAVALETKTLIIKPTRNSGDEVIIKAESLDSDLENIVTNGATFVVAMKDVGGLTYPMIKYAQKTSQSPTDPDLRQKYFRLRRILLEFRSHSRGTMARYRPKIEHERTLKNEMGQSVLSKLLEDKILSLQGNFYILDPEGLNTHLGVTWTDLRKGEMPETLVSYLRDIS